MKEPFNADYQQELARTGRKRALTLDSQKALINKWLADGHSLKDIERATKWSRAIVFHRQP